MEQPLVIASAPPRDSARRARQLDRFVHLIDGGRAGEAVRLLVPYLRGVRDGMLETEWATFVRQARDHRLSSLLHLDPFTRHSFRRPRGYPGDAGLLDLIYREVDGTVDADSRGREIAAVTLQAPACDSVRARREILARYIDETADRTDGRARLLSLAAGHLREAQLSRAVRERRFETLCAIDQDPQSVGFVEAWAGDLGVSAQVGTVRLLLRGEIGADDLDFTWSAGLFDYLPDSVARQVVAALFRRLRSGGRLLVANFAPELGDIGYMEAFMDWHLLYRDEAEMAALAADLPVADVAEVKVWRDPPGNVVYLEVARR